ncbi:MAG: L,D-transpeptidase [Candidatus Cloacimonetes bacterium]|nr:L,D-transpeptidase [Candidatus Cloacimonadota bacterium]MDD3143629.1 L,D-transpeptidase [Candidatus Cloacimonadota bacterium]MDY0366320.1 L,D-transpeptidase [Candidatus Syntrophosphaera sp.]HOY83713.1 L,D-transpeptidase [Candidatus Syntrophosphaera sp.]HPH61876.1 L,D-transpeptidase [Candidatus Syntrophosphaera sp.]
MNRLTSCKIMATMLLLLLFSAVAWGQPANSTGKAEKATTVQAQNGLVTEDGALSVLPANTDSLEAWKNRKPRHITDGYYIIIKKTDHKLHLYKDGVLLKTYPVATGKNNKDKSRIGDLATPEGHFKIDSISASSKWRYTSPETGRKSGPGVYGPWFFAVNTRSGTFSGKSWTGIGIHGTSSPSSIGKFVSHGCIRLYSKDITEIREEVAWLNDPSKIRVDILN